MTLTQDNAIFGHASEDTALVVDDYPYGFRLRTEIRYWIETVAKKGDRFCSQTLNPKTGRWNKPKKSTYVPVGVMYRNEEGHITWTCLSMWEKPEPMAEFLEIAGPHLNDEQKRQVALIKGYNRAFADVTFSVHEGPRSEEEQAEQDKIEAFLRRRVAVETHRALNEPLTEAEAVESLQRISEHLAEGEAS